MGGCEGRVGMGECEWAGSVGSIAHLLAEEAHGGGFDEALRETSFLVLLGH